MAAGPFDMVPQVPLYGTRGILNMVFLTRYPLTRMGIAPLTASFAGRVTEVVSIKPRDAKDWPTDKKFKK